MIASVLLILFLGCGAFIADRVFARQNVLVRILSSILFGLTGLMWCVIPFAFFFDFTPLAHLFAVLLMGIITVLVIYGVPRKDGASDLKVPLPLYVTISAISLLLASLLFLHVIRPHGGALYTGPGTFGDLPLHLGMITSIAEQKEFPPEYSFFPPVRLAYPFLVDSLSATLYLFGLNLRWAILLPSFLFVFAVAGGFVLLAREILEQTWSVVLAAVLFFFSGGLGFIYFLEGARQNPGNFTRLFTGFFLTPTNWSDKNIYMWNVVCHILVPQRAALAGWAMLFFALWLLYSAVTKKEAGYFLLAGIMAGLMPMVHTASFFIFAAIALTWFVVYLFPAGNKIQYLKKWLIFSIPLVVFAVPQLFIWTFAQVTNERYLRLHFNWANEKDPWIWFWLKNVGIVFLLAVGAIIAASPKRLRFYSGAVALFIIAESVVFSQFPQDNNKVFYIWYAFTVILVAGYLMEIFQRMKGMRGRHLLLGMIVFVSIFSGVLTVLHDFVTLPRLFSGQDIEVAEFVKTHTPPDALFVSSNFHNNPVMALAGRTILCGYDGWTYSHGLDYLPRAEDIKEMYSHPRRFPYFQEKYGIDYVYFSDHERRAYKAGSDPLDRMYPKIFAKGDISVYAVSRRAQALRKE